MTKWIYVNTSKITRIGYNREMKTMYIDFVGSLVDTPYKNVPESLYSEFVESGSINTFYQDHIEDVYESVNVESENKFDTNWHIDEP